MNVTCLYCGSSEQMTLDHVPPKCLFPKPRPPLKTVPCCRSCNERFGKDDEWFRQVLVIRDDVQHHPESSKVLASIYRSWQRPKGRGLPTAIFNTLRDVRVRSSEGVDRGTMPAFEVDPTRMSRVLERIVRGLYFVETGQTFPLNHQVTVHTGFERHLEIQAKASEMLAGRPRTVIGEHIFMYSWAHTSETTTIWLLAFYDVVPFLVLTIDPVKLPDWSDDGAA